MHLHDDLFLFGRDCVDCPSQAPSCNCGVNFQCITTSRSCSACPSTSCVPADAGTGSSTKGSGVSGGAIAGAVIGALVLLSASVALLIWYRRRQRALPAGVKPQVEAKSDVPARAEAVLSRPDPVEKSRSQSPQEPESVRMYSVMSNSTINLDPQAKYSSPSSQQTRPSQRGSVQSNPFTDTHSIQTTSASTQSTNVIPIALVPHGSVSSPPHSSASDNRSGMSSMPSTAPSRPMHAPDLGLRFDPLSSSLNLEHVNVSKESFRPPHVPYAQSQASGMSGFSRDSVMTSGSFASDMIYEAPQIVTNAGRVNFSKAEVVSVQGTIPSTPISSSSGAESHSLKPSAASRVSKAAGRSPLAQTSFGPADAISVSESDAEGQDIEYHRQRSPFGDEHSTRILTGNSASTFGAPSPIPIPSTASPGGQYQSERADDHRVTDSPVNVRPASTLTQAASIIGAEIGGATVVRLNSVGSAANNRMTSARLVTPTSAPLRVQDDRVLQQQQAQALAAARARAAASGLPMPGVSSSASASGMNSPMHSRRVSEASVMSTGGDSLLESFTFVPPSPISSRPPRSPLAQQAPAVPPVPPLVVQGRMEPTVRQVQGLSSASTGIEGYDFRLDEGQVQASASSGSASTGNRNAGRKGGRNGGSSKSPPSAGTNGNGSLQGRQRASLDTLALTADLSAFPLNFDEGRGSFGVSK